MKPDADESPCVFTIGHSNLDLSDFLSSLQLHKVEVVCDVRSRPASFRFPQFNREPLEICLREAGIRYEFMGKALGGRPEDPRVYRANGTVNYEKRRKAADFHAGVAALMEEARARRTAILCAEEDPLQCHRFLMIGPALMERGAAPIHIRREGETESQQAAEDRLLELHGMSAFASGSLFAAERGPAIQDALARQANEFAFRRPADEDEEY